MKVKRRMDVSKNEQEPTEGLKFRISAGKNRRAEVEMLAHRGGEMLEVFS